MAYANTFKRREMKFLLNEEQYKILRAEIEKYMTEDSFGKHTILNVYMDNRNNDLIRTSLGKPVYREKLRLRSYGHVEDGSEAFLEIKKKFRGITYKRRFELTYKELHDYITDGAAPSKRGQVFEEIDYMIRRRELVPRIVICYDREAFYGNDDREFRLTFDGNVRFRRNDLDLRSGADGEYLKTQPHVIMEVKSAGAIPLWLVRVLSENKVTCGSFSKYGNIFMNEIRQKREETVRSFALNTNNEINGSVKQCFQV
ncbi:MAG: polyphosphate polymerase domain-containing protein [Lachnospiraceae bacterium]|nr:polyphosphate polymerase domain-containing protein [Ruminococcus sp.]MCM1273925.1 polyphosphate polymerase domain-containing protein [Lachnospiraceae bacterium]